SRWGLRFQAWKSSPGSTQGRRSAGETSHVAPVRAAHGAQRSKRTLAAYSAALRARLGWCAVHGSDFRRASGRRPGCGSGIVIGHHLRLLGGEMRKGKCPRRRRRGHFPRTLKRALPAYAMLVNSPWPITVETTPWKVVVPAVRALPKNDL